MGEGHIQLRNVHLVACGESGSNSIVIASINLKYIEVEYFRGVTWKWSVVDVHHRAPLMQQWQRVREMWPTRVTQFLPLLQPGGYHAHEWQRGRVDGGVAARWCGHAHVDVSLEDGVEFGVGDQ